MQGDEGLRAVDRPLRVGNEQVASALGAAAPEVLTFERPLPPLHRLAGWAGWVLVGPASLGGAALGVATLEVLGKSFPTLREEVPGGSLTILGGCVALFLVGFLGPGVSFFGYLAWLRRRYGRCTIEGGLATFCPPFSRQHSIAVPWLRERRATRFGLRVALPAREAPARGRARAGPCSRATASTRPGGSREPWTTSRWRSSGRWLPGPSASFRRGRSCGSTARTPRRSC